MAGRRRTFMPPQRADDAERHAGVADRRAGLDRPAVALTGDAHRPANGLCDRVERQALLVRATIAEALDLGIDDARIDRADDIVAEPDRSTAPGAKFSVKTSAFLTISLTSARPRSDFRLTVIDRLLALYIMK